MGEINEKKRRVTFCLTIAEMLVDINRLGEYIREGKQDEAARVAQKLADRKIQLQLGNGSSSRQSNPFP